MAVCLREFAIHAAYEAAESGLIKPNVSICAQEKEVHYNPYVDTRVVAKFNVTDTSNPTQIMAQYAGSQFSAIEIDGVEQPSVVSAYTFDTVGEHTVKYTLTDTTTIGDYIFDSCTSLTSIDIPDSVTRIGQAAFFSCTGLTSCTIGSGVTRIDGSAFSGCRSLASITIPNSVTSIGSGIFDDCSSLTSIVSNAITAPTIANTTFSNIKTGGTLTVPSGSSGYDVWMNTDSYYLGYYSWTKVEQ